MTTSALVVAPQDQGRPLCVVGEHITLLAASEAAGGHEIFLQTGPAGAGPIPHSHPWDESFYVTLGEVHFGIESDLLVALPGTLVHLSAGTTHWFRWGADGGAMASVTSGRRGFEDVRRNRSRDSGQPPGCQQAHRDLHPAWTDCQGVSRTWRA